MSKRQPLEVFVTPVGELKYPHITRPDTRYVTTGVYQTKICIDLEDAQELIALAEKVVNDEFARIDTQKSADYTIKPVFEPEYNEEGEPTGRVEFKCKLNAVVTPREGEPFNQTVSVVDENEVPLTESVWGGSMAQIKGQLFPWVNAAQKQVGVTFRMRGVKVLDLVTGGESQWNTGFDA